MIRANPKQLKVSIIVSDLSSSGAGRWGGGVRPFLLAQALKKLNCQVEILGVAYEEKISALSIQDIPIFSVTCGYHSGFLKAAQKIIQRINGDIIYAVKLKPSSFGIALIKKFLRRKKLILDIDDWETSWFGGDQWHYRPNLKRLAIDILSAEGALRHPDHPLYLKWMENLVGYADIVTTHNQFLQKRFGGTLIPNGKDTELFNPNLYDHSTSKAKYGLSDYQILMFPGAPRPYKGLEDILQALDILNEAKFKLVIVGGSPYDDYDQKLKQRWGKWIIQLPKQPVQQMPEIIAAADLIVVPQKNTTAAKAQFPLKLTDGMSMAKPILATRVGDIPNIVAQTAYLVEPDSPPQLAQGIKDIFADYETAYQKAQLARARCVSHYSIDAMADSLSRIIENLYKQ